MPLEAVIGEWLVRAGLPVACLVAVIWAHVRISTLLRKRLDLPAKLRDDVADAKIKVKEAVAEMKADMKAVDAVAASLQRHLKSEAAFKSHESRAARQVEKDAAPPPPETTGGNGHAQAAAAADLNALPPGALQMALRHGVRGGYIAPPAPQGPQASLLGFDRDAVEDVADADDEE